MNFSRLIIRYFLLISLVNLTLLLASSNVHAYTQPSAIFAQPDRESVNSNLVDVDFSVTVLKDTSFYRNVNLEVYLESCEPTVRIDPWGSDCYADFTKFKNVNFDDPGVETKNFSFKNVRIPYTESLGYPYNNLVTCYLWNPIAKIGTSCSNGKQYQNNSGLNPIFRFWSSDNRHHFYTNSVNEKKWTSGNFSARQWKFEDIVFYTKNDESCETPIYRFWSEQNKGHFYTASLAEKESISSRYTTKQWNYEGVAYCAMMNGIASGSAPLYRFWSEKNHGHFYTIDEAEKRYVENSFTDDEWLYEGVAYYVFK